MGHPNYPRLAIIGCGAVAEQAYVPALRRIGWMPTLLVDPNRERTKLVSKLFKGVPIAVDIGEFVDDIDVAIVSVPHNLHAQISIPLLQRGIGLLVEKPMATTETEAVSMIEAAEKGNAILSVGLFRRFLHGARWVKSGIEQGLIGEIRSFDVREGSVYAWPVTSDSFWRKEKASGGVLIDIGAHTLDLLLWWLGDSEITNIDYKDDADGGVEADCIANFSLNNGATGVVEFSRTRLLRSSAIIKGTKGMLEIDLTQNKIQAHPSSLLSNKFEGINASKLPAQGFAGLFVAQLKEWLSSIEEKRMPFVSGKDSLSSIRLIEQCYNKRERWNLPWVDIQPHKNKGVEDKDHGTLQGKTVLVTGATGFIGGRLVEKLINEYKANVNVLIRDYSRAARIARFSSVKMIHGDLGDYDTLCHIMKDCEFVFHCAFDPVATIEKNISDICTLSEACLHTKIKKLVHVSTLSVYEPLPDGNLTEESPAEQCGFPYADAKLAVEREILCQVKEKALPATIIQPTIVYGPYSKPWTDGPINQLLTGTVVLPDEGMGLCNAVYVDDVVDAMILASQSDNTIGERFLISGPETVSWNTFFQAYSSALELEDGHIQYLSRDNIIRRNKNPLSNLWLLLGNPKRIVRITWLQPILFKAKDKLGENTKQLIKKLYASYNKVAPSTIHMPDTQQLLLYAAKSHVQIDAAQNFLGYQPMFDFKKGMELTAKYVQWSYHNRPHS